MAIKTAGANSQIILPADIISLPGSESKGLDCYQEIFLWK